ncbi:formylglycine-generating enzyme family protein [Accumulibacter sp.]|uniref:formylglycine-generating enzyme family protein n=1 Tax=Accumulibacter sp. TaxID=2053492 RepID=UPI0028792B73|nr:formylglycine-generating enzyme family protein [Accumulibacter sp.]MDS4049892.1 formylglycine-generating enzyme family protein [Accumulibacter sp.]
MRLPGAPIRRAGADYAARRASRADHRAADQARLGKGDRPGRARPVRRSVLARRALPARLAAAARRARRGLDERLPSEAEWEYACRAGTTTPFSFGANITPEQVNYDGRRPYAGGEQGVSRQKTVPVGSLPANPWGFCEMHGNVWEWCADWYGKYPATAQVDPQGPPSGAHRVLRGGSWYDDGRVLRSALRYHFEAGYRNVNIGFRLARGPN